jgi:hypothetical protein
MSLLIKTLELIVKKHIIVWRQCVAKGKPKLDMSQLAVEDLKEERNGVLCLFQTV